LNCSYETAATSFIRVNTHTHLFFKYIFFFLATLSLLLAVCPGTGHGQTVRSSSVPYGAFESEASPVSALNGLETLRIYRVYNGKMTTRTFDRDSLEAAESISIPGYVSGIVAVGKPGLSIRVAGKQMTPVQPDADGKFSLGYYGIISPAQLTKTKNNNFSLNVTNAAMLPGKDYSRPSKPTVYTFLPLVPADTITDNTEFLLEISSDQSPPHRLPVFHGGATDRNVQRSEGTYNFQYIGFEKNDLPRIVNDTEKRLQAISEGVAAVESYFQTDLVKAVNIINYDDIYNAVTYLDHEEIWFYINTFKDEPIDELKVIAQHEALHILVDKLGLTANKEIREMFAELKGFHEFSMERYQLMSHGNFPSSARLKKGEEGDFFEFISERNYLDGMKGGHPQGNLDEFCTSFLHTLMYPERFETNLMEGGGSLRIIDSQTRENILDRYISLLKIVRNEMKDDGASSVIDVRTVSHQVRHQLDALKNLDPAVALR
jgi:hypothetical protein